MAPSLELPGDDERLQTDVVLPNTDLVKADGVQPANDLVATTIVRVKLCELPQLVIAADQAHRESKNTAGRVADMRSYERDGGR